MKDKFPRPTIKRLVLYKRLLEDLDNHNTTNVYSYTLAKQLGLNAAIIRKDISMLGSFGNINSGYNVKNLIKKLTEVLYTNKIQKVILIGLGNIGKALLGSKEEYISRGFDICKVFDKDQNKTGKTYNGIECLDIKDAYEYIKSKNIKIAILAIQKEGLDNLVTTLIDSGINSFLNFVPQKIQIPKDIHCESIDFTMKLEELSYYMNH